MQDRDNQIKLEITQDKLVDILMHAATRDDIANLSNKTDLQIERLENKIDTNTARLDNKIDASVVKLENKIDGLSKLIITGILIPIALFIIDKVHF